MVFIFLAYFTLYNGLQFHPGDGIFKMRDCGVVLVQIKHPGQNLIFLSPSFIFLLFLFFFPFPLSLILLSSP